MMADTRRSNDISVFTDNNSYQKRLKPLTLPVQEIIRSIDILHVHDPRRQKRVKEERSRGMLPVASPLTVEYFGVVIDFQQRTETRDERVARECIATEALERVGNKFKGDDEELKVKNNQGLPAYSASDNFWDQISRLEKSSHQTEETSDSSLSKCKIDIPFFEEHPQRKEKDGPKSVDIGSNIEGCDRRIEESNKTDASRCIPEENTQGLPLSTKNRNMNNMPTKSQSHPFDTALTQLDKVAFSKMGVPEKFAGMKKTSVTVSADTTSKSQEKHSCNTDEIICRHVERKTPELLADKVGTGVMHLPVQIKKSQIKVNLSDYDHHRGNSANSNKKLKTNENLHSCIGIDKKQCLMQKHTKSVTTPEDIVGATTESSDSKAVNNRDSIPRKRPYQAITLDRVQKRKKDYASIDKMEEINKKRRKRVKEKFRRYFGKSISVSEDEEEERILRNRFSKRRKKDSVDSCDSGVCVTEENVTPSNFVRIVKEIQKAVPDSTIQECNEDTLSKNKISTKVGVIDELSKVTHDESATNVDMVERVPKITEVENIKLLNDKCKADSAEKHNSLQSTKAINTTEICQKTGNSEVITTSVMETETAAFNVMIESVNSQEICNIEHDDQTVTALAEDFSKPPNEDDVDTKEDLIELLHMNLTENCQIKFDGNVLSIPENAKKDTNQNVIRKDKVSNMKESKEEQWNSSHDVNYKEQTNSDTINSTIPNDIEECNNVRSEDVIASNDMGKDIEIITTDDNLCSNDKNGRLLPNPHPSHTTGGSEDAQLNKVPHARLRVLSSAELGSRWCPTPVMPDTPSKTAAVPVSASNIPLQTIPITVSVAPPPASVSLPTQTVSSDFNYQKEICTAVENIFEAVKRNREITSEYGTNFNNMSQKVQDTCIYDTALMLIELEKLGRIINSRDYEYVVRCVLDILNKKLETKPLSFEEFCFYVPVNKSLYYSKPWGYSNNIAGNPLVCDNPTSTTASSTTNQYVVHNRTLQRNSPASATATYRKSRKRLPNRPTASQNPPNSNNIHTNVVSKKSNDPKEKLQQSAHVPPQRNLPKNNTSVSFTNNSNMQQMNYTMNTPQSVYTPKHSHAHFVGKRPVMQNMHTSTRFPSRYVTSVDIPQQPGQHFICTPMMNIPISNQHVQQNMYISQGPTFHTMNMPVLNQPTCNATYVNTLQNTTIPATNQQLQYVTQQQQPVYDMLQRTVQPQNIQQTVPLIAASHNSPQTTPIVNYGPQTIQLQPNTSQHLPSNMMQKEDIPQHTPIILRQNPVFEEIQMMFPQYISQNTNYSQKIPQSGLIEQKTRSRVQSQTTKEFYMLKHLTDIQKIMLLKQIHFHFKCSLWLRKHMTVERWYEIHSALRVLLLFRESLNNYIQKTIYSHNESEVPSGTTITLVDIETNASEEIQSIMQENRVQVQSNSVSKVQKEQPKSRIQDQSDVFQQRDLSVILQNKSKEIQEVAHNSLNTGVLEQTQESNTLQKEDTKMNKEEEQMPCKSGDQIQQKTLEEKEAQVTKNTSTEIQQAQEKSILQRYLQLPFLEDEKKQEMEMSKKLSRNVSGISQDIPKASDLEEQDQIALIQLNSNLVTVEISRNNDQVKVIDTNAVFTSRDSVIKSTEDKTEESEQFSEEQSYSSITSPSSSSPKDNNSDVSTVLIRENLDSDITENVNDSDMDDLSQQATVQHIADVRSISLDVYEKMGENNSGNENNTEGEIEEEDRKVCLQCSKVSTVVCGICLEAHYCSKACSELHWKEHYKNCKPHSPVV